MIKKHGYRIRGSKRTKEYMAWDHMKQRCNNPKNPRYKDYGGRGIRVCNRWLDFKNFLEDMGPAPSKTLTLERINNNLGYSKENCKWATTMEQSRNKRGLRIITMNGDSRTIIDWSNKLNINSVTIRSRIKRGWDYERALLTPPRKKTTLFIDNNSIEHEKF